MSKVALSGNASGTGTFTIASPNGNTDRTLTLPDNTGTVVTTGSTSVVTPAMLTQPLTSGTAVASTSGTSIDFTSIPSWVKRITVMFQGVSTSGSSNFQIQLGAGSFSTSGYSGSGWYHSASTISAGVFTTGIGCINTVNASYLYSGLATICNINGNAWTGSVSIESNGAGGGGGSGSITLGGTLDRVRITTVNGTDTFDAGSINILYE